MSETVLVTGGSGFVGAHCLLQLMAAGYRVRTTVRSLEREAEIRAMLRVGGVEAGGQLTVVAADLLSDVGWADAVAGCRYVLHVASPFPMSEPEQEEDLIVPAREGALQVLRAARDAQVARVVMTSSFAAIGYSAMPEGHIYSEADWTNPDDTLPAYIKSKTIAERAAWDFIYREGGGLELAVVNPTGIFGPVLGTDYSASIRLIQQILEGKMPEMPPIPFGIVDVRDVADLQLRAMTNPAAKGERFLAVAGSFMTLDEIAVLLREGLGERVTLSRPSPFSPGAKKQATNEKARRMLGWSPRSNEETIRATVESLMQLGLVTAVR